MADNNKLYRIEVLAHDNIPKIDTTGMLLTNEGIAYVKLHPVRIEAKPKKEVEVPPIKVGDTAHFIINGAIYEATIWLLYWNQDGSGTISEIRGSVNGNSSVSASFSDWGKTVFATREEAKAALAKKGW